MSINKSIGKRIREIRKRKDITAEKMAEVLNISYSTYQRIESGETSSWSTHLDKICEVFEVETEEIILDRDKYIQIIKDHSSYSGDVIINQLSEKLLQLYEDNAKRLESENIRLRKDNDRLLLLIEKLK